MTPRYLKLVNVPRITLLYMWLTRTSFQGSFLTISTMSTFPQTLSFEYLFWKKKEKLVNIRIYGYTNIIRVRR